MRPRLLRPPVERLPSVKDFSGVRRVNSEKSLTDICLRPGDVGLYFLIPIFLPLCYLVNLKTYSNSMLPSLRVTNAFFQSGRLPKRALRMRLRLPRQFIVCTSETLTPSKIASTLS